MRLSSGSLYKAFKNKRGVFLAAFARYVERRNGKLSGLLEVERTGLDKLKVALRFYAESAHGLEGRRGCLVVGGAVEMTTLDKEMAGQVRQALWRNEAMLRDLAKRGQADGSIPAALDADAAALTLHCLLQGMRIVGKAGRTAEEMASVASLGLRLVN